MSANLHIEVRPGDATEAAAAALTERAYEPDELKYERKLGIVWAKADQRVMIYDGGELIAAAGIFRRRTVLDGEIVRMAGLGGVKTARERQGEGLGRKVVETAMQALKVSGQDDFALLFCNDDKVAFYEKLGWRVFSGKIYTEQLGKSQPFAVKNAMTYPLAGAAPTKGVINMCGKPW